MRYLVWNTQTAADADIAALNAQCGYPNGTGCLTAIQPYSAGSVIVANFPEDCPNEWLPGKARLSKSEAEAMGAIFPSEI